MTCEAWQCGPAQECKVNDGELGCVNTGTYSTQSLNLFLFVSLSFSVSFYLSLYLFDTCLLTFFAGVGICHIAGDPHYYTFDGIMHTYMGTCTYTLVAICNTSMVTPFTIVAKNEERGQPEASYVRSVTVYLPTANITISKSGRVLVRA